MILNYNIVTTQLCYNYIFDNKCITSFLVRLRKRLDLKHGPYEIYWAYLHRLHVGRPISESHTLTRLYLVTNIVLWLVQIYPQMYT